MIISVLVKTGSNSSKIVKLDDGSFIVRVKAKPVNGKANLEVIKLLSKNFTNIKLIKGNTSSKKLFSVTLK